MSIFSKWVEQRDGICNLKNLEGKTYNVVVGGSSCNTKNLGKINLVEFIIWCKKWTKNIDEIMGANSNLYI